MGKHTSSTLKVLVIAVAAWTASSPAFALGDCGPNRHRNGYGFCVWGGQNQHWCLRRTGYSAGYGGYGSRWCSR